MSGRGFFAALIALASLALGGCAWIDPPTPTSTMATTSKTSGESTPTASGGLDTIGDAAVPPDEDAGPIMPIPTAPIPGSAVAIAAGYEHTCAVTSMGAAYCWGSNGTGQLGNGGTADSPIPDAVTGLSSVTAIVAGAGHTCALSGDDAGATVKCWGRNDHGQLGDGTTTQSNVPVTVVGLHAGVTAIASGPTHVCALVSDGVQCWGANEDGELGNGTTADSATPVVVTGVGVASAVAAGGEHSCAIVAGALKCWGWNEYGQLGDGTTTNREVATAVPSMTSGATAVSTGAANTCAIALGATKCWGYGQYGQIGNGGTTGSLVPAIVSELTLGQAHASAGCMFACAVSSAGKVTCWGDDQSGQIGDNDPSLLDKPLPTDVIGLTSGASLVATGTAHACAIVGTGVQCWGWNVAGQLGNDLEVDSPTPVAVIGF